MPTMRKVQPENVARSNWYLWGAFGEGEREQFAACSGRTIRTHGARVETGSPLRFSSNNGRRTESCGLVIVGYGAVGRLHLRPTAQIEASCYCWR